MPRQIILIGTLALALTTSPRLPRADVLPESATRPDDGGDSIAKVDFAREVYPILKRSCFDCHGPDTQKGDLRLDVREEALNHGAAIVPGDLIESEVLWRVELPRDDPAAMPSRGDPLSDPEIETLRRWIAQGADWPERLRLETHWAYEKPRRPDAPPVVDEGWSRNGVDRFVLARLEAEGLRPMPEADRATLIRRVTLDLLGLPPEPAEIDAFLADRSPEAYERLVDRLLGSPEFGGRWARPWLDLARYADSHGYQRDDLRESWAYRDWVIDALNADMPFDLFSIEQLAGDLLPGAGDRERIATGFHRAAPLNVEAGSQPEETRVNQVIDRVNTTATVWLGSTLGCAQCHDHKYDPFSQAEYYRLFAFFNNTEIEAERSNPKVPSSIKFLGVTEPLPDPDRDSRREAARAKLARLRAESEALRSDLAADLGAWAESIASEIGGAPREEVLRVVGFESGDGSSRVLDDGSILRTGDPDDRETYVITAETDLADVGAIKLEALTHDSLPGRGPGRGDPDRPNFVLNDVSIVAGPKGRPGEAHPVALVGAEASFSQKGFAVARAIDDDPKTAWAISPRFGESHWAVFRTGRPIGAEGETTTLRVTLVQSFGAARTIGRVRLSAIAGDLDRRAIPEESARLLRADPASWSEADRASLLDFRAERDDRTIRLRRQVAAAQKEVDALSPDTTLVMRELETPRTAHVFRRGDYRTPGDAVRPGTPDVLHPIEEGAGDRLGLARWLVDRENPLVARVTVNRWWAELFGQGLVATPGDFGLKGDRPTHPDLLDWLAVEFMESGWSMKRTLRTIVTSATYRQGSDITPGSLDRDPANLLLGRGPRHRLDAEAIRDNALAIAGLLDPKAGGPPIRPDQPDGLWTKVGGQKYDYVTSPGSERHRRGVYVVWKRGSPYPSFITFDAPGRLDCTARRTTTDTPQQALTLLNDPVYVEAARALARRIVADMPDGSTGDRIEHAFRLCTGRSPDAREQTILLGLHDRQRSAHRGDSDSGDSAAWFAVATALLNLDETITKG